MNPYWHELLSRLKGRTTIAVLIVTALTLALGFSSITSVTSDVSLTGGGFEYYSAGAYHVSLWVYDIAGLPVSGVRIDLTVTPPQNESVFPPPPPPPAIYNETRVSDAAGAVDFVVAAPHSEYTVDVYTHYSPIPKAQLNGVLSGGFFLGPSPAGVVTILGPPVNTVESGYYLLEDRLAVLWSGPNGTVPTGDSVQACAGVYTYGVGPGGPVNCTGLVPVSLGPLTGFVTLLPYPSLPLPPLSIYQQPVLFVQIVNASGAVLYLTGLSTAEGPTTSPGYVVTGPGPGLLSGISFFLGLLLPLEGFVVVYWSYARPRLTGTVDMVLVRPVTRRGLFFVRTLAAVLGLAVSSAVIVLALDLGLYELLRQPLPGAFLAPLIGGLLAAGVSFAALVLLASHRLRSPSAVIALGVTLLLALSLFWNELVGLFEYATGTSLGSSSYTTALVQSQLLAPPQLPSLVVGLLTLASGATGGTPYAAAGVGAPVVATAAVLWVAVPLLLTYWCVVRRD